MGSGLTRARSIAGSAGTRSTGLSDILHPANFLCFFYYGPFFQKKNLKKVVYAIFIYFFAFFIRYYFHSSVKSIFLHEMVGRAGFEFRLPCIEHLRAV